MSFQDQAPLAGKNPLLRGGAISSCPAVFARVLVDITAVHSRATSRVLSFSSLSPLGSSDYSSCIYGSNDYCTLDSSSNDGWVTYQIYLWPPYFPTPQPTQAPTLTLAPTQAPTQAPTLSWSPTSAPISPYCAWLPTGYFTEGSSATCDGDGGDPYSADLVADCAIFCSDSCSDCAGFTFDGSSCYMKSSYTYNADDIVTDYTQTSGTWKANILSGAMCVVSDFGSYGTTYADAYLSEDDG